MNIGQLEETTAPRTAIGIHHAGRSLINGLSSIRTGIALLIAIIVYSALGSAVPPLRQYFEYSETAWFGNCFFGALILLFSLVLMIATVRRIRFNLVNLGVLTVHTGLLMLAGGAMIYFGGKVEGDVMLEAPRVLVISKARMNRGESSVIGTLIAAEGKQWETSMPMAGGTYRIRVERVRHSGMKTAANVTLAVTTGDPPQARTIELSQDDRRRGGFELNDQILLSLQSATNIDRFYHGDRMALTVGAGRNEASFPLDGLPRYYERVIPGEDPYDKSGGVVRGERSSPIPLLDNWTLPISVKTDARAETSRLPVRLEVDGYLPYAELTDEPTRGGSVLDPVALVETIVNGRSSRAWLTGRKPVSGRDCKPGEYSAEFRWMDAPEVPAEWTEEIHGRHVLVVIVKDKGITRQYDVSDGQEITVEGTDYRLKIDGLLSDWPLMTPGFENARSPVAQVSVSTPAKHYQRTVIDRYPHLSQDIDEGGRRHREGPYDVNLVLRYADCSAPRFLIAAAANASPTLIYTATGGQRTVRSISPGETFSPAQNIVLKLSDLIDKPTTATRPVVIPEENRQRNMGRNMSLVRVNVRSTQSDWSRRVWVPFTQYGYLNDRRSITVSVPEFGPLMLTYGRQSEALAGQITLEQMAVTFNPGRSSVRDWKSQLRMEDRRTGQISVASVFLNNTSRFGGHTLFQSGAAQDHESWTILGVGNRIGIMPMTLGCIFITLGLLYAFYVKPVVKARLKQRFARQAVTSALGLPTPPVPSRNRATVAGAGVLALFMCAFSVRTTAAQGIAPNDDVHNSFMHADTAGHADKTPSPGETGDAAVASLKKMAPQLNLDALRLLVVQHGGRYETLESWAREVVKTIHGDTHLDGLDPVIAALEIAFNANAHIGRDIIYIKDLGVRNDLSSHPVVLSQAERRRIRQTGMVSYRFLNDSAVSTVFGELKSKGMMQRATDRLDSALFYFESTRSLLRVVPGASRQSDATWHTLDDLLGDLRGTPHGGITGGLDPEKQRDLMMAYARLGLAWPRRDSERVNLAIGMICDTIPSLSPVGAYMSLSQRRVDAFYHRMNAFTWGWGLYLTALVLSIWSVVTAWRPARVMAMCVFCIAFILHGVGLALRWYIIGRVPVANMFESVVASAWLGAAIALGLELRVLRAWQTTYLIPLATAIILQQTFKHKAWFAFAGIAAAGLLCDMIYMAVRRPNPAEASNHRRGIFVLAACFLGFMSLALGNMVGGEITTIAGILDDVLLRIHTVLIITSYALVTLAFGVANCYLVVRAWNNGTSVARVALGCQVGTVIGLYPVMSNQYLMAPSTSVLVVGLACLVGGIVAWWLPIVWQQFGRSAMQAGPFSASLVAAGWSPRQTLPRETPLLKGLDLSQMTLLNMANVGLFVGMILGAVWADYSWGRPWGWDPKEVFALTTWLIYAILIHTRYVARDKALWSAVVAVIGFAMMMFNWWAVNFFIVGLHSYA